MKYFSVYELFSSLVNYFIFIYSMIHENLNVISVTKHDICDIRPESIL